MWKSNDILDLQLFPTARPVTGYCLNIRPELMADDLKTFVVTPRAPVVMWHDDRPTMPPLPVLPSGRIDTTAARPSRPVYAMVCLSFPDEATARASSLGRHWA